VGYNEQTTRSSGISQKISGQAHSHVVVNSSRILLFFIYVESSIGIDPAGNDLSTPSNTAADK
jgi:hypothetical protein